MQDENDEDFGSRRQRAWGLAGAAGFEPANAGTKSRRVCLICAKFRAE